MGDTSAGRVEANLISFRACVNHDHLKCGARAGKGVKFSLGKFPNKTTATISVNCQNTQEVIKNIL